MAEVGVDVKVLPEDMEKFDSIKTALQEKFSPTKLAEEELAFGMKAIRMTVIIEDAEGGTDKLEKQILEIDGVKQAEIEAASRI